jgi:hypothetical protein|tara:strand:- start:323 stop:565 length:243 start_codon:yes stop_codon:yes gene_type:complete
MSNMQLQSLVEGLGRDLQLKYGGNYQIKDNLVTYTYSGIKAQISFDKLEVNIQASLGFMMTAFKGAIEEKINLYLEEKIS